MLVLKAKPIIRTRKPVRIVHLVKLMILLVSVRRKTNVQKKEKYGTMFWLSAHVTMPMTTTTRL